MAARVPPASAVAFQLFESRSLFLGEKCKYLLALRLSEGLRLLARAIAALLQCLYLRAQVGAQSLDLSRLVLAQTEGLTQVRPSSPVTTAVSATIFRSVRLTLGAKSLQLRGFVRQ